MRIVYVAYPNAGEPTGVGTKIATQLASWRGFGHDVHAVCLADAPRKLEYVASQYVFGDLPSRYRMTSSLVTAVCAYEPSVVYIRHDLYLPPLLKLLRRYPTVVELNTDLRKEVPLRRNSRAGATAYARINHWATLSRAAGVVCVTHELAETIVPRRLKERTEVIGNGVDLAARGPLAAPENERPRLLFIGNPAQEWQGIDKLIALAEALPSVGIDMVGAGASDLPPIPSNLVAHGRLDQVAYERVFANCDAGLSPLALHRKGLAEASPLKVREYLAYGLPVVLAHEDTDFRGTEPWFLKRIPNAPDNIERAASEIGQFVHHVRGKRVTRSEVAERIDATGKEARRLALFERIVCES